MLGADLVELAPELPIWFGILVEKNDPGCIICAREIDALVQCLSYSNIVGIQQKLGATFGNPDSQQ